jgi:hypothetical protein
VGYESWVDRHSGRAVRHAPDYFARRADGTAAVIDVRDGTVFATTAQICVEVGWGYERVGELGPAR